MGPHPAVASARLAVRRALTAVPRGSTVLVACSGGADSLALLAATVFEARAADWRVIGATVDHGLQLDSAERAARVVTQMADLGADETVSARVVVDAPGMGPEAAARAARHDVLEQMREHFGAEVILLGHTQDDQAETVLLGLTRGSGGRSLAGMRRSYDQVRRPFLDLTRAATEAACLAEGIDWWDDPHNYDPGYARVRVRRTVLPMLERELGPGVAATLARTADQLRIDADHLDDTAERTLATIAVPEGLPIDALADLHPAIRLRVLRLAAVRAGAIDAELFFGHIVEIDRLITDWRGQTGIDLPGHLHAIRDGQMLVFGSKRPLVG